jgi:hypothetical protein
MAPATFKPKANGMADRYSCPTSATGESFGRRRKFGRIGQAVGYTIVGSSTPWAPPLFKGRPSDILVRLANAEGAT